MSILRRGAQGLLWVVVVVGLVLMLPGLLISAVAWHLLGVEDDPGGDHDRGFK